MYHDFELMTNYVSTNYGFGHVKFLSVHYK